MIPLSLFFVRLFARTRLYPRVAAGDVSGEVAPLLVFFAKLFVRTTIVSKGGRRGC